MDFYIHLIIFLSWVLYPQIRVKFIVPSIQLLKNVYKITMILIVFSWHVIKLKYNRYLSGYVEKYVTPHIEKYVTPYINQHKDFKIISKTRRSATIEYAINDKKYRFITGLKRGPSNIAMIKCEDNEVTDKILPYLGPNEDFHNIRYTPESLGYSSLDFYTITGEILKFNKDEEIKLN